MLHRQLLPRSLLRSHRHFVDSKSGFAVGKEASPSSSSSFAESLDRRYETENAGSRMAAKAIGPEADGFSAQMDPCDLF